MTRDQNIYFDNARAFRYTITLEIPEGYQVQGLEGKYRGRAIIHRTRFNLLSR